MMHVHDRRYDNVPGYTGHTAGNEPQLAAPKRKHFTEEEIETFKRVQRAKDAERQKELQEALKRRDAANRPWGK